MATETKEYTFGELAEHDQKESAFIAIHDKVYDVTKFVDEHPGGEEVMMDVAGQDGTEAFEDIGHSDEAREILEKYYVGELKRGENDPKPAAAFASISSTGPGDSSGGIPGFVYAILVALVAAGGYYYLQQQQQQKA
ncbi:hypothetical protein ABW19_dt0203016 [Dactylella cylindrospora]|nr:hypothetical protein ABW19_dt0203016 [Dactylella cylindrospora]